MLRPDAKRIIAHLDDVDPSIRIKRHRDRINELRLLDEQLDFECGMNFECGRISGMKRGGIARRCASQHAGYECVAHDGITFGSLPVWNKVNRKNGNNFAAILSLIEPVIMLFMGAFVAFVLIALYLPIFSLADSLS